MKLQINGLTTIETDAQIVFNPSELKAPRANQSTIESVIKTAIQAKDNNAIQANDLLSLATPVLDMLNSGNTSGILKLIDKFAPHVKEIKKQLKKEEKETIEVIAETQNDLLSLDILKNVSEDSRDETLIRNAAGLEPSFNLKSFKESAVWEHSSLFKKDTDHRYRVIAFDKNHKYLDGATAGHDTSRPIIEKLEKENKTARYAFVAHYEKGTNRVFSRSYYVDLESL